MKKKREEFNEDENEDRLSDLPDCVLHHIFSSLTAKEAVQTCILSTRWKHLWKRLPTLRFHSLQFKRLKHFTKFVTSTLSLRDDSTSIHTLTFNRHNLVEPHIVKRIVNYAVSHNVQELGIYVKCEIQHFPSCLFSCQTLTSLKLALYSPKIYAGRALFPNSLNLPALSTLCLGLFLFPIGDDGRAEPFSVLKSLKNLIIDQCAVVDSQNLCISSATLVSLTIVTRSYPPDDLIEIELLTPNLCNFTYIGSPFHKHYGSKNNLSSIEHVNIDLRVLYASAEKYSLFLLEWLVELANVKSLALSSPTLQVLSLVPDLFKVELPSLCNMKSLIVERKKSSSVPDGIVDFLTQNSPSAKVEIIDEIDHR